MPIDLVPQLVSAAIRACGLGLVTFVSLWLLRVRSSAARHALWTVVLAGMLVQIPLGMVVPTIPVKTLSSLPNPIRPLVRESARNSVPAPQGLAKANRTGIAPKGTWFSSGGALTGAYLAIALLLFFRMIFGGWGLRRILRDAKAIPSLGPDIFESASLAVPGSVGCFRPRILLPRAWTDWDAVKLRAVLAHERAHIRRRDWLIRVASRVNVCIFWFHPLAWWIERELARLAEEACDDAALCEMGDREGYAATLVDIAHAAAAHGGVLNWQVMPMAKESNVIRRVNRILNLGLQIPKPFGRLASVSLFACGLPVIYLSAAVKLLPANRDSTALSAQTAPNRPRGPAAPRTPSRRPDPPITMCILLDNSGSMREKRALVTAVALALVRASKPGDEVCIVDFNDEVLSLPYGKDFTSDIQEMEKALTSIDSRGGTAMRDAIQTSIDHVEQKARNSRKVLVLVTEGEDTSSTVTQEQLLGKVKNSGVRVYSLGLLSGDALGGARLALRQLAEASGGLDYYAEDLAEVESISLEIASELRKQ
jgi:Mg-chelatase subunit ChlD